MCACVRARADYTLQDRKDVVSALRRIDLNESSPIKAVRRWGGAGERDRDRGGPAHDERARPRATRSGEFIMIRGPSGGGKTTLVRRARAPSHAVANAALMAARDRVRS